LLKLSPSAPSGHVAGPGSLYRDPENESKPVGTIAEKCLIPLMRRDIIVSTPCWQQQTQPYGNRQMKEWALPGLRFNLAICGTRNGIERSNKSDPDVASGTLDHRRGLMKRLYTPGVAMLCDVFYGTR